MITKEEYILNRTKFYVEKQLEQKKMINPEILNELMEQWNFDYEMELNYRPEILERKDI